MNEIKPIFTIPNILVTQKDYAYLYSKDNIAEREIKLKRNYLKSLKKKINKLVSKKAKLDHDLNYWEYKLLDQEIF